MELIGGVAARIEANLAASQTISTHTELAAAAGIAKVTFFRKLKDEDSFTLRELRKVSIALGCGITDLIVGTAMTASTAS